MRYRTARSPEHGDASRLRTLRTSEPWAPGTTTVHRLSLFARSITAEVRDDLRRDLQAIEASLARVFADSDLRTDKVARDLLSSGGKWTRALLTCAVCRAVGGDPTPHADTVAAVELAHSGSLLHDDILDGAETRRGRLCAHLVFDVSTAILAGDQLLVLALDRIGGSSARALRSSFTSALRDLCVGEALERERRFDPTVDLAHARRVNRLKTASLFAYAAEAGAILGGGARRFRSAARSYGFGVGEAFQLTDDLLDVQGDPVALGKPIGTDLTAGLITAPVAIALERDPALRDLVREIWRSDEREGRLMVELCERMERIGALGATRELVSECVDQACVDAEALPTQLWRDQLSAFACAIVGRQL